MDQQGGRFGNAETDAPPLLCLQHFRGNLDNWDPALVGRLAQVDEAGLLGVAVNRPQGHPEGLRCYPVSL